MIASGLREPVFITSAPDGSGSLYVVERAGLIKVITRGRVRDRPFIDIRKLTIGPNSSREQGLLGLAFHPRYPSNRRFFVHHTDLAGSVVIAEYKRSRGAPVANLRSRREILEVPKSNPNHNGGTLAFGPDGYLYISIGDGGTSDDPEMDAQSLDTLLGKILRIDVNAKGVPYAIPPDNPFAGMEGARGEIWAYGLRHPWRFSIDTETGDLWIGDVGQDYYEEVDLAPAGEGGLNFGWNLFEGNQCHAPYSTIDPGGIPCAEQASNMEPPVLDYSHEVGCSVTGGHIYRGGRISSLADYYLYGDFCNGEIYAFDPASDPPAEPTLVLSTGTALSSFGVDGRGEIYFADFAGGGLYKVVGS